jgi:hypothetical protein
MTPCVFSQVNGQRNSCHGTPEQLNFTFVGLHLSWDLSSRAVNRSKVFVFVPGDRSQRAGRMQNDLTQGTPWRLPGVALDASGCETLLISN